MGRVAVIDIGTVTCRLGLADVEGDRVLRCDKKETIGKLGEGVAQKGRLSREASERAICCVDADLAPARRAQAEAACCALTSAARDATNASELLGPLRERGVEPRVIAGEVEGSLTFLGVARDFSGRRILVADSGGGSTELAVGILGSHGLELEAVCSLDVGCRRATDLFLSRTDPPAPEDVAQARAWARGIFDEGVPCAARGDRRPETLVCVGGTVTTLVAMHAGLDPYDPTFVHLSTLRLAGIDALASRMAAMPLADRRSLVGLQPKRASVILGGALVVGELMRSCGFSGLTVSESDLLYGLALCADAAANRRESLVGWSPTLFALR